MTKGGTKNPARPWLLSCAISRMAFTDSCCAGSMKEQVLTTMTSASSARGVISAPAWASRPIMTSLSTRFLGHPRLTKPTLVRGADPGAGSETGKVASGRGFAMPDFDSSIRVARAQQRHPDPCGEMFHVERFSLTPTYIEDSNIVLLRVPI